MKNLKMFKQLTLAAGLLALCSVPAAVRAQQAQQPPQSDPGQQAARPNNAPNGGPNGERHADELANLNLTDDQKAQIEKIHASTRSQMDALKNDSTLTPDQKREKAHELHKATHQQVMQVLTPEQRQQMRADERAHKAEKQQSSQAPPPQQ
jgi:Spy/CpxP family protein refolding chaperone